MRKKLLIYIVSYNHDLYLDSCIDSVMPHKFPNMDVILIDSGSSDRSIDILKNKSEEYSIKLYLKRSKLTDIIDWVYKELINNYEFVMRVDADDMLLPGSIQKLLNVVEGETNIGAVSGSWVEIDKNSKEICKVRLTNNCGDQAFHGACTLLRVSAISNLSFKNEKIDAQDGWYTWLFIRESWDIVTLSDFIFKYRRHNNNLTKDNNRLAKNRSRIYSKFFNKLKTKSLSCVVIGISQQHLMLTGVEINDDFNLLIERQLENIEISEEVDKVIVSGDIDYLSKIVQPFSKAIFQYRESDDYNLTDSLKNSTVFKKIMANYSDIFIVTPTKNIWSSYYFDLALYQKYIHNYNSVIICKIVRNEIYKHVIDQGLTMSNSGKSNEFCIKELLYERVPGFVLFDRACLESNSNNSYGPIGFIPKDFLSHYS
jgi:glycosyltransferase involved in cell wall biosynthesis